MVTILRLVMTRFSDERFNETDHVFIALDTKMPRAFFYQTNIVKRQSCMARKSSPPFKRVVCL